MLLEYASSFSILLFFRRGRHFALLFITITTITTITSSTTITTTTTTTTSAILALSPVIRFDGVDPLLILCLILILRLLSYYPCHPNTVHDPYYNKEYAW